MPGRLPCTAPSRAPEHTRCGQTAAAGGHPRPRRAGPARPPGMRAARSARPRCSACGTRLPGQRVDLLLSAADGRAGAAALGRQARACVRLRPRAHARLPCTRLPDLDTVRRCQTCMPCVSACLQRPLTSCSCPLTPTEVWLGANMFLYNKVTWLVCRPCLAGCPPALARFAAAP